MQLGALGRAYPCVQLSQCQGGFTDALRNICTEKWASSSSLALNRKHKSHSPAVLSAGFACTDGSGVVPSGFGHSVLCIQLCFGALGGAGSGELLLL